MKNVSGVYYHDEPHEADTSLYYRIDDETHTLYIRGHEETGYTERVLGNADEWVGNTSITTAIIEEDIYPSTCVRLFQGNTALETIENQQYLHTGNATSMFCMFYNCNALTALDTSKWDTSNVSSMNSVFSDCRNIKEIDTSRWNTSNVTNTGYMFKNCSNLEEIDVSNFDVRKVEHFNLMFATVIDGEFTADISKLERIEGIENWQTDCATEMYAMFAGASALKELNLNNFKTNNVTDLSQMFLYCESLEKIYVENNWTIDDGCDTNYMFYGCSKLVGGAGTTFNSSKMDGTYARIDDPANSEPGYFTQFTEN